MYRPATLFPSEKILRVFPVHKDVKKKRRSKYPSAREEEEDSSRKVTGKGKIRSLTDKTRAVIGKLMRRGEDGKGGKTGGVSERISGEGHDKECPERGLKELEEELNELCRLLASDRENRAKKLEDKMRFLESSAPSDELLREINDSLDEIQKELMRDFVKPGSFVDLHI